MRNTVILFAVGAALAFVPTPVQADLLSNGNLDVTYQQEIVPGFFLPKPASWQNIGTRALTGPYEDEMSSEPWAGPAPTPVTADGVDPDGPGGNPGDWAVFFKPFSGGGPNGPATGHLQQDVPGTPGETYTLTGWAGAEANALMSDAQFAVEFLNGGGGVIGGTVLSLMPTLFVDNGLAFDYKQYTVVGVAPAGTVSVRARASMIDAIANPNGGGQAFVVDDFALTPEPTAALGALLLGTVAFRRRR